MAGSFGDIVRGLTQHTDSDTPRKYDARNAWSISSEANITVSGICVEFMDVQFYNEARKA